MPETLNDWLAAFDQVASGAWAGFAPDSFHHDGGEHAHHVVIGTIVHGDEVGGLPAVVRVARALREGSLRFGGRVTLFIGNRAAAVAGERFLEHDLNRVIMADAPDSIEGRRARELLPILDAADVFIDLHQTILPSQHRFWIAPFQVEGWQWVRALAATPMWVTRDPGTAFTTGACCTDEYVRNRGRTGLTLELGARGFGHGADTVAEAAIRKLFALSDAIAQGTDTLARAAEAQADLQFLETTHRERFGSDALALREGIVNFQPVEAGENLAADGCEPLVAPHAGWVLFPKYPPRDPDGSYKKPLPGEIYRIVSPLATHPLVAYADALKRA